MSTLKGFDAADATGTAAKAQEIAGAGYGAVGLYYFHYSDFKTLLTRSVAETLAAAGIKVWSIFESGSPTVNSYFTVGQGNTDGHMAGALAAEAGQPAGLPIYATVDVDIDPGDLPVVVAYFTEFRRVLEALSPSYTAGCYGSGLVCRHLSELGLVSKTWLAGSRGWAQFTEWESSADIIQGVETELFGLDVDLDEVDEDAGLWVPMPA